MVGAVKPSRVRHGLAARLLLLTAAFVMLAEVLIFAPSVARFRLVWLEERLASGHLAALAVEAAPAGMVTEQLERELLAHTDALAIDVIRPNQRVYMLAGPPVPEPDAAFDLRNAGAAHLIADAFRVLLWGGDRIIRVTGRSPRAPEWQVAVVLREAPLRRAMLDYSARILGLSILISLVTAGLVFVSLHGLLVRPIRRLTASIMAFRSDPGSGAIVPPSDRTDEIGMAQRELVEMQETVRTALRQQQRLAALGSAVAKLHHDLGGILATAALVSERVAASDDPEVRRIAPRLMRAIDRAMELSAQTVAYTRDGVLPLKRTSVDLRALVDEVGAELADWAARTPGTHEGGAFRWENEVAGAVRVAADPDQLFRVLANLGRNAVQAGAGRVRITAHTPPGPGPRRVVLHVADDGPGLPPRARENLFTPFAPGRSGGSGLGLAIAKEVLVAHGGGIMLVRSDADGTEFALELPADP